MEDWFHIICLLVLKLRAGHVFKLSLQPQDLETYFAIFFLTKAEILM